MHSCYDMLWHSHTWLVDDLRTKPKHFILMMHHSKLSRCIRTGSAVVFTAGLGEVHDVQEILRGPCKGTSLWGRSLWRNPLDALGKKKGQNWYFVEGCRAATFKGNILMYCIWIYVMMWYDVCSFEHAAFSLFQMKLWGCRLSLFHHRQWVCEELFNHSSDPPPTTRPHLHPPSFKVCNFAQPKVCAAASSFHFNNLLLGFALLALAYFFGGLHFEVDEWLHLCLGSCHGGRKCQNMESDGFPLLIAWT